MEQILMAVLNSSAQADTVLYTSPISSGPLVQFVKTFVSCAMLIVFSELGDKTFFIVVILSAKQPKYSVFVGSFCALITMTVLSALMGIVFVHFASPSIIRLITFCIYGVCGCYILYDSVNRNERPSNSDTFKEASNDIENIGSKICIDEIPTMMIDRKRFLMLEKFYNILRFFFKISKRYLSPVLLQAYFLVFFAEWGDRSQIATVFMAQKHIISAVSGAIFGHFLCTICALMCGWLASSVSTRKINIVSGIIFILFALHSLY